MRNFLQLSLRILLCSLAGALLLARGPLRAQETGTAAPAAMPAPSPDLSDPHALYDALNDLKLDGTHVYAVKDLTFRRDAFRFGLTEGSLAFLQAIDGRITGAVFVGRGHVVGAPRDPGERRSLSRALGVPILDQTFTSAYLRFTDDTAAELQHQIEAGDADVANDPNFATRWAPALASFAPSHSLRIMEDLLAAEPKPYFYALLRNDTVGSFDVIVDQRRDEQVMVGQLLRDNGVEFYDVWTSFRAEDAPAKPTEYFRPVHYSVDSVIGDDLALTGKTTVTLKVVQGGERFVHLELSRNLAVSEILGADGKPVVFFQNQDLTPQEAVRRGNDFVFVVLPAPPRAGDELELEVRYHGNVIANAGNGVEFVGERGTWFAHLDGEHFAMFDLSFHWPKRLTLVATGDKIETHEDADSKSGKWKSEIPFATAGFNLGEYKVATTGDAPKVRIYANKELEEAITSRLQARSSTRLETTPSFVNPLNGTTSSMVAASPTLNPNVSLNELSGKVLDSIQFFRNINGAFPLDHLDISQIPGSFGQGWPGLIYLSTLAFLPADTQEQAGITEWTQRASRNLMPFHEVVHQWWGNETIAADYRDTWIEEGLAHYLAILYSDSKKPSEHRLASWLDHYRGELLVKVPGSNEPIEQTGPLTLGPRLASEKVPDAYATIMYGKGTWVVHMLHEMMREPGTADPDAKFRELLQSILKDYKYLPFSTDDFKHALERHMNPRMDLEGTGRMNWFFDEWVRGTGIPHYTVKYDVKPKGEGFVVTGVLQQTGVSEIFTAPIPIYASHGPGKPEKLGVVITTGNETHFHFGTKTRPSRLVIDPQLTVLCSTN
ncbi:MAG TPA: M1 family aminopeptidase [Candidatus Acidoferrales bacterium]